ncbi:MAG: PilW family protein [Gallionella sp.]|nr:PilW family protein [Gallionella sp.]
MKTFKIPGQCRTGIPTEYKAINRLFLNEGGFTLIELLVGLALGLIASLAIFSTVSTFETQRRTTGGGADMQQNGLLALYSIEQDIRMAGYGLVDASTTPGNLPCVKVNNVDIAPVKITDGGTGSDSLTTHRLDSDIGGIVTGGGAAKLTATSPLTVDTTKAIHTNDYLLIPDANKNCLQTQVATIPSSTSFTVSGTQPSYVPTTIINLGQVVPTFPDLRYQVDTSFNLNHSVNSGTNWNTVASDIVNMQMQYGVANAGSQPVSCWTDATGSACSGTNWATPSAAEIARIKAIRVAIVARSAQKAACTTTTVAPVSWVKPNTTPASSNAPLISLSTVVGQDWQCYRYKVYQTIIPVRNVIWGNL